MKAMRCIGLLVFCLSLGFAAPAAWAQQKETGLPAFVLIADAKSAPDSGRLTVPVKKTSVKKAPVKKTPVKKATARKPAAKSQSRKEADVIATPVPAPKLDLSLPKDMVKDLKPPTQPANAAAQPDQLNADATQKPILPAFFSDKGSEDFQLNGRLLNNEMQLQQRRNDGREVEGAALDFNFRQ